MCGFTGFLTTDIACSSAFLEATVTAMALAIRYRGPDDAGSWVDKDAGIALGHRRLSIIDISPAGHQPMLSPCGRFVLAFNGEIYNHLAIRAELQQLRLAPEWRGHSDTETLLAGFAAWGVEATLKRSVGMFAIALWDKVNACLSLARDRFGEKPLYYGWVRSGNTQAFLFGSELKALRSYPGFNNPLSRGAVALYMQHSTVPAPYSIYEDIFKLQPGVVLRLSKKDFANRSLSFDPYWRFMDVVHKGLANPILNESEALSDLEKLLRQSVAEQMVADVPLGAFLSGGVDSSTIVALMQTQSQRPIETFTVGFDEVGFDESPYALEVARHLGTNHHEIRLNSSDARSIIPLMPQFYDEPFADSSQIPTSLISRISRPYVTVALSGDAGDELFGGYNRYFWAERIWNRIAWMPPFLLKVVGRGIQQISVDRWDAVGRKLPGVNAIERLGDKAYKLAYRMQTVKDLDDLYRSLVTQWPRDIKLVKAAPLLSTLLDDTDFLADIHDSELRMMVLDTLTYLPDDILMKVDRAAMGVSLETRVPFLDHRVAELAWRLPLSMKIRGGEGKWALRQILYKYVPKELIERPKAGFAIPIAQWLRGPLREWAETLLDERRLEEEGYLNPLPIRLIWKQHLSGRYDWSNRLWTVLMFQAWLESQNP